MKRCLPMKSLVDQWSDMTLKEATTILGALAEDPMFKRLEPGEHREFLATWGHRITASSSHSLANMLFDRESGDYNTHLFIVHRTLNGAYEVTQISYLG